MPEIQVGTTDKPILVIPRIGGVPVTQTQIKNDFSNAYVDDISTPLSFVLEYKNRTDTTVTSIAWNEAASTESQIFFDMPDAFWANLEEWTVMVAWTIAGEKNYTVESVVFAIKDMHRT